MYEIIHSSFDQILMKARARYKGKEIFLQGTWAFAPELSWYDTSERRWLSPGEWRWIFTS